MNTMIYLPKFGITIHDPYVSNEVVWVVHQEPTTSRVSFNCFTHFISSCFFLADVKRTFTNFLITHHNLGSSSVTSSRLGDFTSKSHKCHKYYFIKLKCSSTHKEDLTQPYLEFLTNQPNLTKRCSGEVAKAKCCVFLLVEPATLKGGKGGGAFVLSQKTSR
jgi:hypothetical protein